MRTPSQPAAVELAGISKIFPGVKALDNATLSVAPGEVHGLIGENGAGKSTLIKILAGVYRHDAGSVRIHGEEVHDVTPGAMRRLGLRFIHQELHLVPHFTVAESVFLGQEEQRWYGIRHRHMRKRAAQVLHDLLGVDIDPGALIRDISPAERKLVQVARALVEPGARVVVFDEPTAPLAHAEVSRVLDAVRRLRDSGIAIVYVSHYLEEITGLCDRVTVFRNGTDVGVVEAVHDGDTSTLIRMMTGRDVGDLFPPRGEHSESVHLSVNGLSDGRTFTDVDLTVRAGEVVGIAGLLGSGAAELVDTLMGLRKARGGTVSIAGDKTRITSPAHALAAKMVLIPRDRRSDGLVLDFTVEDNISLSTLDEVSTFGLVKERAVRARAEDMIRRLDIRPPAPRQQARFLSGGNQQKVVLARALEADATVLIFDDPTVGVDIGAKAEIYRLIADLAAKGAAVVVSSNDPAEILGLCHRVEVIVRGRITASLATDALTHQDLVEAMTSTVTKVA